MFLLILGPTMAPKVKKSAVKVAKKIKYPKGCAVQDEDPSMDMTQQTNNCLAPGKALQELSGVDMHCVRSASLNNARNPKYLCILPGLMSLKRQPARSQLSQQQSQDTEGEPKEVSVLGRLKNAQSANPKLSMGPLTMEGTRVRSSSRYLLLNLQPRTGKVTCKHVFSEVVVFGDSQLKQEQEDMGIEEETVESLNHYGASLRAQGVTEGAFVRESQGHSPKRPGPQNQDSESDSDGDFAMKISPVAGKRTNRARRASSEKTIEIAESDQSEEESEDRKTQRRSKPSVLEIADSSSESEANSVSIVAPPSRPRSRRASAQNRKSFKLDSSSSDGGSSNEESGEDLELDKKTPARRKAPHDNDDSDGENGIAHRTEPLSRKRPRAEEKKSVAVKLPKQKEASDMTLEEVTSDNDSVDKSEESEVEDAWEEAIPSSPVIPRGASKRKSISRGETTEAKKRSCSTQKSHGTPVTQSQGTPTRKKKVPSSGGSTPLRTPPSSVRRRRGGGKKTPSSSKTKLVEMTDDLAFHL